jgi:hypothetical protein
MKVQRLELSASHHEEGILERDALKLSSLKLRKLREAELRNRRKRRPFNGYNARPLE